MSSSILGIDRRVLVVAEIGSNHLGDPDLARRTVEAAARAGADAVKGQLYDPDTLVAGDTPVLGYISGTHRTQRERFRSLQLGSECFLELAKLARELGMEFLMTPFDEAAVEILDPVLPAFKVASGDLTNTPLLRAVVATGKPIILSTGLATLEELDRAVESLPGDRLVLLHCVGAYPTPDEDVNLCSIPFLRERYGVPVGFSDHSIGITASAGAVALGARLVEKHFILARDLPAADRQLSIDPAEFRQMVDSIRRIERMLGSMEKKVRPSENYFRENLRRALYARRAIPAGTVITSDMLIPLRPCSPGMVPASDVDRVVGRTLLRAIETETPIRTGDLA